MAPRPDPAPHPRLHAAILGYRALRVTGRLTGELRGPPAVGTALPRDPMGRADMTVRVPRTRERIDQLAVIGLWAAPAVVDTILFAASTLEAPGEAVVVHGDLHVRHVLVSDAGAPSAVIDWGDLCVADPAVDLSLYWSVLD